MGGISFDYRFLPIFCWLIVVLWTPYQSAQSTGVTFCAIPLDNVRGKLGLSVGIPVNFKCLYFVRKKAPFDRVESLCSNLVFGKVTVPWKPSSYDEMYKTAINMRNLFAMKRAWIDINNGFFDSGHLFTDAQGKETFKGIDKRKVCLPTTATPVIQSSSNVSFLPSTCHTSPEARCSVFRSTSQGYLETGNCSDSLPFACELNVAPQATIIQFRFEQNPDIPPGKHFRYSKGDAFKIVFDQPVFLPGYNVVGSSTSAGTAPFGRRFDSVTYKPPFSFSPIDLGTWDGITQIDAIVQSFTLKMTILNPISSLSLMTATSSPWGPFSVSNGVITYNKRDDNFQYSPPFITMLNNDYVSYWTGEKVMLMDPTSIPKLNPFYICDTPKLIRAEYVYPGETTIIPEGRNFVFYSFIFEDGIQHAPSDTSSSYLTMSQIDQIIKPNINGECFGAQYFGQWLTSRSLVIRVFMDVVAADNACSRVTQVTFLNVQNAEMTSRPTNYTVNVTAFAAGNGPPTDINVFPINALSLKYAAAGMEWLLSFNAPFDFTGDILTRETSANFFQIREYVNSNVTYYLQYIDVRSILLILTKDLPAPPPVQQGDPYRLTFDLSTSYYMPYYGFGSGQQSQNFTVSYSGLLSDEPGIKSATLTNPSASGRLSTGSTFNILFDAPLSASNTVIKVNPASVFTGIYWSWSSSTNAIGTVVALGPFDSNAFKIANVSISFTSLATADGRPFNPITRVPFSSLVGSIKTVSPINSVTITNASVKPKSISGNDSFNVFVNNVNVSLGMQPSSCPLIPLDPIPYAINCSWNQASLTLSVVLGNLLDSFKVRGEINFTTVLPIGDYSIGWSYYSNQAITLPLVKSSLVVSDPIYSGVFWLVTEFTQPVPKELYLDGESFNITNPQSSTILSMITTFDRGYFGRAFWTTPTTFVVEAPNHAKLSNMTNFSWTSIQYKQSIVETAVMRNSEYFNFAMKPINEDFDNFILNPSMAFKAFSKGPAILDFQWNDPKYNCIGYCLFILFDSKIALDNEAASTLGQPRCGALLDYWKWDTQHQFFANNFVCSLINHNSTNDGILITAPFTSSFSTLSSILKGFSPLRTSVPIRFRPFSSAIRSVDDQSGSGPSGLVYLSSSSASLDLEWPKVSNVSLYLSGQQEFGLYEIRFDKSWPLHFYYPNSYIGPLLRFSDHSKVSGGWSITSIFSSYQPVVANDMKNFVWMEDNRVYIVYPYAPASAFQQFGSQSIFSGTIQGQLQYKLPDGRRSFPAAGTTFSNIPIKIITPKNPPDLQITGVFLRNPSNDSFIGKTDFIEFIVQFPSPSYGDNFPSGVVWDRKMFNQVFLTSIPLGYDYNVTLGIKQINYNDMLEQKFTINLTNPFSAPTNYIPYRALISDEPQAFINNQIDFGNFRILHKASGAQSQAVNGSLCNMPQFVKAYWLKWDDILFFSSNQENLGVLVVEFNGPIAVAEVEFRTLKNVQGIFSTNPALNSSIRVEIQRFYSHQLHFCFRLTYQQEYYNFDDESWYNLKSISIPSMLSQVTSVVWQSSIFSWDMRSSLSGPVTFNIANNFQFKVGIWTWSPFLKRSESGDVFMSGFTVVFNGIPEMYLASRNGGCFPFVSLSKFKASFYSGSGYCFNWEKTPFLGSAIQYRLNLFFGDDENVPIPTSVVNFTLISGSGQAEYFDFTPETMNKYRFFPQEYLQAFPNPSFTDDVIDKVIARKSRPMQDLFEINRNDSIYIFTRVPFVPDPYDWEGPLDYFIKPSFNFYSSVSINYHNSTCVELTNFQPLPEPKPPLDVSRLKFLIGNGVYVNLTVTPTIDPKSWLVKPFEIISATLNDPNRPIPYKNVALSLHLVFSASVGFGFNGSSPSENVVYSYEDCNQGLFVSTGIVGTYSTVFTNDRKSMLIIFPPGSSKNTVIPSPSLVSIIFIGDLRPYPGASVSLMGKRSPNIIDLTPPELPINFEITEILVNPNSNIPFASGSAFVLSINFSTPLSPSINSLLFTEDLNKLIAIGSIGPWRDPFLLGRINSTRLIIYYLYGALPSWAIKPLQSSPTALSIQIVGDLQSSLNVTTNLKGSSYQSNNSITNLKASFLDSLSVIYGYVLEGYDYLYFRFSDPLMNIGWSPDEVVRGQGLSRPIFDSIYGSNMQISPFYQFYSLNNFSAVLEIRDRPPGTFYHALLDGAVNNGLILSLKAKSFAGMTSMAPININYAGRSKIFSKISIFNPSGDSDIGGSDYIDITFSCPLTLPGSQKSFAGVVFNKTVLDNFLISSQVFFASDYTGSFYQNGSTSTLRLFNFKIPSGRLGIDYSRFRFHLVGQVSCAGSSDVFSNVPSEIAFGSFSRSPSILSVEWKPSSGNVLLVINFDMPVYFPILGWTKSSSSNYVPKELVDQIVRIEPNMTFGQSYYGYMSDADRSFVIAIENIPDDSELISLANSIKIRVITDVTNWRGTSRPVSSLLSPNATGRIRIPPISPGIQLLYALTSTGQFGNLTTSESLRSNIFDSLVVAFTNPLTLHAQTDRYLNATMARLTANVNLGSENRLIWLSPNIIWIDLSGVTGSWMTSPKNFIIRLNMTVSALDAPSLTLNSVDNTGISPIAYSVNPNANRIVAFLSSFDSNNMLASLRIIFSNPVQDYIYNVFSSGKSIDENQLAQYMVFNRRIASSFSAIMLNKSQITITINGQSMINRINAPRLRFIVLSSIRSESGVGATVDNTGMLSPFLTVFKIVTVRNVTINDASILIPEPYSGSFSIYFSESISHFSAVSSASSVSGNMYSASDIDTFLDCGNFWEGVQNRAGRWTKNMMAFSIFVSDSDAPVLQGKASSFSCRIISDAYAQIGFSESLKNSLTPLPSGTFLTFPRLTSVLLYPNNYELFEDKIEKTFFPGVILSFSRNIPISQNLKSSDVNAMFSGSTVRFGLDFTLINIGSQTSFWINVDNFGSQLPIYGSGPTTFNAIEFLTDFSNIYKTRTPILASTLTPSMVALNSLRISSFVLNLKIDGSIDYLEFTFTNSLSSFRGSQPELSSKNDLSKWLVGNQELGISYEGRWTSDSIIRISNVQVNVSNVLNLKRLRYLAIIPGIENPVLSPFTTVNAFEFPPAPKIVAILASNPPRDFFYDVGDVIKIIFDQNTDKGSKGVGSPYLKSDIDYVFGFSEPIGQDYTGTWIDAKTFEITIRKANSPNPNTGFANNLNFPRFRISILTDIFLPSGISLSSKDLSFIGMNGSFTDGICKMPPISISTASGDTTFMRNQEILMNAIISSDLRVLCPTALSFKFIWSIEVLTQKFLGQVPKSVVDLTLNTKSLRLNRRALIAFPLGSFNANVSVTMVHPDGELQNSASLPINLISSGILVRAFGGNLRSASTNNLFSLDSTFSIDQDDPCGMLCFNCTSCSRCTQCLAQFPYQSMDNSPFTMTWDCMVLSGEGFCPWPFVNFTENNQIDQSMTINSYSLSYPKFTFSPGKYQFTLNGVKDPWARTDKSVIIVEMASTEVPSVSIALPAVSKVNPTEQYTLQGTASLPYASNFIYSWNVTNTLNGDSLNLTNPLVANANNRRNLIIRSNVFEPGQKYAIRLTARGSGGETGFSQIEIVTNEPPADGTCSVSPESGIDVNTTFTISCSNWNDEDAPLLYMFSYLAPGTGNRVPIVRSPQSIASTSCFLPAGSPSQNYTYNIVVDVFDSLGDKSSSEIQVKVESISASFGGSAQAAVAAVSDLVSTQLTSTAQSGNQDQVLQLASVVTQILNSASSNDTNGTDAVDTSAVRATILTAIINTNDANSVTSSSILQVASVVANIISKADQIDASSQNSTANFIESMAAATLVTGLDADKGSALVDTLGKLMDVAVVNSEKNDSSSSSSSLAESTTSKVVSSVEIIAQASVQNLVVGDDPVVMTAGNIAIVTQVHDDSSFQGSQTIEGSSAGLTNLSLSGIVSSETPFYAQVSSYDVNPFFWSADSANVSSSVISASVQNINGSGISVNNTGFCIGIIIPAGKDDKNATQIVNGTRYDKRTCSYWNPVEKRWQDDGCKVDLNRTNANFTYCCCQHLTFFGIEFKDFQEIVVPPKQIDFTDTSGFKDIQDNRVLFALCCIYFLFAILSIIGLKMDLRDIKTIDRAIEKKIKRIYDTCYVVSIFTGDLPKAGTDARVFLSVQGKSAAFKDRRLQGLFRNKFERKSRDDFTLVVPSLGAIEEVTLRHDNTGFNPSWYVEKVEILDTVTGEVYLFQAKSWIDNPNLELKLTDSTITTDKDVAFRTRFKGVFRYSLKDAHLWYSIFAFPRGNLFTRLERVGVCMLILMVKLAISGAFLQGSLNGLKPLQVIYVGIVSSLMAFPGVLLVSVIFKRSYPYPKFASLWNSQLLLAKSEDLLIMKDVKVIDQSSKGPNAAKTADLDGNGNGIVRSGPALEKNGKGNEEEKDAADGNLLESGDDDKKKNKKTKKRKKGKSDDQVDSRITKPKLPYWSRFIAWILVLFGIAFSTAVTLFYAYGIDPKTGKRYYDVDSSTGWILALIVGVLESNLVSQPIRVILVAAFLSRHPINKTAEHEEDILDNILEKLQDLYGFFFGGGDD